MIEGSLRGWQACVCFRMRSSWRARMNSNVTLGLASTLESGHSPAPIVQCRHRTVIHRQDERCDEESADLATPLVEAQSVCRKDTSLVTLQLGE